MNRTIMLSVIVAGIVYLAANDHDGWGWLVLLAILVA